MEEKFYQVMLEERRMKESRKVMIEKSNMTSKTKELMLHRNETSASSESVSVIGWFFFRSRQMATTHVVANMLILEWSK